MHGTATATPFSRRHFILTLRPRPAALVVGIAFAPDGARAATISKQPWNENGPCAA